ncbi:DUF4297 domain-containing protein [Enterococcus faecalis]|uniref:dsDNA nuclease domain-containing protein n=1 Tax=Enterococcus TaxID=1350 RepID=UPI000CF191C7|nr:MULTISPECIES: dsDNA nuclease domain-containing protein [Enterococcus]EGO6113562.1 DUF4297 domain-containing protein [Enterococcus faecalis]EJJ1464360.1 DUF4297 domain-containing protein [Enterococcus faecalis]EME5462796.1 DUF4297 domain-containing protein [Enterococcus faecalis]MBA5263073.1 DUF4297 domain-containing protein [Enterococcus hirae]PQC46817.1 DUF4297 domain-containing protein [Enterococcus faecalis]
MSNEAIYMKLPFDLSGSRSKNRFRYEILWGLSKLFDIYNENESFVMVFDYACDIEVHKDTGFDFYQVKSKKDGAVYTQGALLTKKKLKDEERSFSILGRLYSLANNQNKNIHVNLVSNKPFQDSSKKNHTTIENLDFSSLDEEVQNTIKSKIQEELGADVKPDMSKISFIYTSIDLFSPDDTLRGKTSKFFLELTGSEPKKPNALYNLLVETISEKACYELKLDYYSDILNRKGLSKDNIDKIISLYSEKTDRAVEKASMFIDTNIKKPIKRSKLKRMLGQVVFDIESGNKLVLHNEELVVQSIFSNLDKFDVEENDFIDLLVSEYSELFTIEYSEDYKYVFFLLILMKVEENIYEYSDI